MKAAPNSLAAVSQPHSLEAERAALGALLLGGEASRTAISSTIGALPTEDFYLVKHQVIYGAIRELYEKGEQVDLVTMHNHLERMEKLEAAGGRAYLAGLLDDIPLVSNMEEYVKIISAKASMRRVMDVGSGLYGKAAQDSMEVEELIQAAAQRLYEISLTRTRGGLQPLNKLVLPQVEKIEDTSRRAASEEGFLTGLPTGFHWLDQMTAGLQNGEMVVVAARPGMGKTSFALNIAEHVSRSKGVPVMIFSIEMSIHDIVVRLLCSHAQVNSHDVRRGHLYGPDRSKIFAAAGEIDKLPIWIDDSSRLTPLEVRSRARRVLGETRSTAGLIIVDYIQLMDFNMDWSGSRPENRQQEITAISRSMKSVAKELGVPVMVLSQLSRAPERREGKSRRPRLSDLRESGAIEQDADAVMFIYQDDTDNPSPEEGGNRDVVNARIALSKNRNGPTGTFPLEFQKAWTRFYHRENFQLLPEDE